MMSPLRSSDEPTSSSEPSARRRWAIDLRARPPQRRRLGPAAGLGDGLGVGREQDGEPEPDRDLDLEAEPGRTGRRLDAGRRWRAAMSVTSDGRDLDDEHDRVLDQQARVELAERVRDARPAGAPGRRRRAAAAARRPAWPRRGSRSAGSGACRDRGRPKRERVRLMDQKTFPAFWRSCSTIGPSARAGKNVSAPTMITTPMSRTLNSGPVVGNVPERRRDAALGGHRAGEGEDRDDHPVPADEHRDAAGDVVEGRVAGQAARTPSRCCRSGCENA